MVGASVPCASRAHGLMVQALKKPHLGLSLGQHPALAKALAWQEAWLCLSCGVGGWAGPS